MAKKQKKKKITHYSGIGGQAVLEGVMMKNKDDYAVAVRKSNGEIDVDVEVYHSVLHGSKIKNVPFIRGVFNFVDSLVLGMKAINHSALFFDEEEMEPTGVDKALDKVSGGKGDKILMGITTAFSIVLAVGLFILLPYFISLWLTGFVRNQSLLSLIEGAVRIVIFLAYIIGISLMKDIRRLYQYHGAEHKCINCIERGRELTLENVKRASRIHKRCGTSFMFLVILISVILFFFIRVQHPAYRVLIRVALIPVIAGISYEIIRLAGRSDNIFVTIVSAPGLWLQHATTKEPDDSMIEVAIKSVEAVFDWKAYLKEEFDYDVDYYSSDISDDRTSNDTEAAKDLVVEDIDDLLSEGNESDV